MRHTHTQQAVNTNLSCAFKTKHHWESVKLYKKGTSLETKRSRNWQKVLKLSCTFQTQSEHCYIKDVIIIPSRFRGGPYNGTEFLKNTFKSRIYIPPASPRRCYDTTITSTLIILPTS